MELTRYKEFFFFFEAVKNKYMHPVFILANDPSSNSSLQVSGHTTVYVSGHTTTLFEEEG